jgi:hypothetical protein
VTGDDAETLIARLIAGDGAELPPWLVPEISKARCTLAWSVAREAEYSTRKELLRKMRAIQAAVELVRKSILGLDIANVLLDGDDQFLNQNEMYHGLGDLAARAAKIVNRIPARKGRDKFFPRADALILQVNCALMVCVIWKRAHGESPPSSNLRAQHACDGLWKAAGGPTLGRWGTSKDGASVAVWRDYLRTALRSTESKEARFLDRKLDDG